MSQEFHFLVQNTSCELPNGKFVRKSAESIFGNQIGCFDSEEVDYNPLSMIFQSDNAEDAYFRLEYYIIDEGEIEKETYPQSYEKLLSSGGVFSFDFYNLEKEYRQVVYKFLGLLNEKYNFLCWVEDGLSEFLDEKSFVRQFNRFYFF